jgi:PadR family transcriptional regulator
MRIERELMRGAGPTAILQILSRGEKYGYELVQLLDRRTDGVLAMGQSTLYPLLYNLESKGLIAARIEKANGRPRRYYRITDLGRKRLARDLAQFENLSTALGRLGMAGA